MTDLRIADAPELTVSEVNDSLKIPTGGYGNYSITMITIRDWLLNYKMFATESYVDTKVGVVTTDLNNHKDRIDNPHQVTKTQVGLGNVDNTSDINKPVSAATQAALTNLNTSLTSVISVKANAADVYTKSEVYTKVETDFLKTHNNLTGRDAANAHSAVAISTDSGEDQQTINDYIGVKWRNKLGGYDLNARVMLDNGGIVRSTVSGNTSNPNSDMTGWVLDNDTSQVTDLSGKTQLEINNSKSVTYLQEVFLYDGLTIKTTSYHADNAVGGNTYFYDASLSKSLHNGGKYIDPLRPFPSDWANKTQQQAWFTAAESGTGLFVLVKSDHDICASDFGVHPELDSSYAIQSAVNYSAYRCAVYADVPINTSETLNIPNGAGLRGDHYTHNSRSTLKSNILNYSGTGNAVQLGAALDSARNVTLADIHLFDVLGTARMGVLAYNLIGSHVDLVVTGFEVSAVVQNYLYYINKFKVFGNNYRKNGLLIGGNINEGFVEYKLISTSTEIGVGFSCGINNATYGVLASASNNPKIYGSVEQHSGRHFDFNQIRGGDIRPYMESPAPSNVNYQSIQMSVGRCYGVNFNVYASGKSSYSAYVDNSRDCKISGEIKGALVADLNITGSCFGIDTSELHAAKVTAVNYSTGRVVGRAANSNNVRESYGAATATPTSGGYGVGSKLWYTNPTILPERIVVTDVTLNTSTTPNTITKTTASVKLKEVGKLITVAGSFGTLAATTVSGAIGDTEITINTGANNLLVGDYLSIPSNSGSYKIDYIYQDSGVTKARLNRALTTAISSATVSYFTPSYEPIIVETT